MYRSLLVRSMEYSSLTGFVGVAVLSLALFALTAPVYRQKRRHSFEVAIVLRARTRPRVKRSLRRI
jgi:cbb3-type cytochrome oxidase subunit 3